MPYKKYRNLNNWFNCKFWLAAGLMLLIALAWNRIGMSLERHLASTQCQECHLTPNVSTENARILLASQEKLCASCHPKAIQLSHPSGFMPKHPLPATFPVDWKGELTCSSCHLIHGDTPGLMRSATRGAPFCLECHDEAFFERMPDRGASMVASGHLDARENLSQMDLDAYSLQCVECHDEKIGNAPTRIGLDSSGIMRHVGTSLSHPIGRVYEKAIQFGGYRPMALLPSVIVLPDGKISCVSCHEGYSKKHGHLTVNNQGSALCLTCHDL